VLDTVVLLPDERSLDLAWRTAVPLRTGSAQIRELRIYEKAFV
jgi:hypothetical protein